MENLIRQCEFQIVKAVVSKVFCNLYALGIEVLLSGVSASSLCVRGRGDCHPGQVAKVAAHWGQGDSWTFRLGDSDS